MASLSGDCFLPLIQANLSYYNLFRFCGNKTGLDTPKGHSFPSLVPSSKITLFHCLHMAHVSWGELILRELKLRALYGFCLQCGRPGFDPWIGKIPWGRKWQPCPVFSPGESHGQRNMAGYSPWGWEESDTTERLHFYPQPKISA